MNIDISYGICIDNTDQRTLKLNHIYKLKNPIDYHNDIYVTVMILDLHCYARRFHIIPEKIVKSKLVKLLDSVVIL